ncbi:MAG: hypothetical protein ACYCSN_13470 [Acidobacteriaceae bacterium]
METFDSAKAAGHTAGYSQWHRYDYDSETVSDYILNEWAQEEA